MRFGQDAVRRAKAPALPGGGARAGAGRSDLNDYFSCINLYISCTTLYFADLTLCFFCINFYFDLSGLNVQAGRLFNDFMDITGKTALVTGAARRVGKAIALQLAASGADVIVHYNSSNRESDEVAAEILTMGRQSHTIYGDLNSVDAIRRMAAELDRHSINIDILVNSAAVYYPTPLPDVDEAQWDHILNVNLKAPFFLAQIFGLKMKARGYGRIVNIADCNTRRVYRNFSPYLASKAGLATLTEALALELSPEVTVNAVAPGTVLPPENADDEFRQQAINRSPLKKAGTPEDIALMVDYLVTRGDFMTGTVVTVDGGATIR